MDAMRTLLVLDAINPLGTVMIIHHTGLSIVQSSDIMNLLYLEIVDSHTC